MEATIALEAALEGRDAIGVDVARAAHAGLAMFEYNVKGGARTPVDIPMDVLSRRDVSTADRLLAAVPPGRHGDMSAHGAQLARQDPPFGFGWIERGRTTSRTM